jgi:hypothetical protein
MICRIFARSWERLVAPIPVLKAAGFDPEYLDRKVRLLQHLIAGLTARGPAAGSAEPVFDLACMVARSPVVTATGAGWPNLPLLFHRSLERLVDEPSNLVKVLTTLLELPLPTDADEARAAGWPDPFKLLVRVPDNEAGDPSLSRRFKLRPLGQRLVACACDGLRRDNSLLSVFNEQRRPLNAIAFGCGPERRKLVMRRLEILNSVMDGLSQAPARSQPNQSSNAPATSVKRRRTK